LQVVARNGLVKRQRHHLVGGPHLRPVEVDEKSSGAGSVRRSRPIVRRRGRRCRLVGDRLDAVRHPGQRAEHFDELGIDPLGDGAVTLEQRRRRRQVELRIRPKPLEELAQRALEADALADRLHLSRDALDFP
jgi:hypothetical protein